MQKPELEVVYQHDDWLVLNKPAGFSIDELAAIQQFSAFHPVHRLDKDTSGLWLVALKPDANKTLSQAFAKREVTKHYLAITHNSMKKKQGQVKGDMTKSRRSQWQLLRSCENPAITHFNSVSLSAGKRLVLCQPVTGKTHQIRVAMKANGAAILGDSIYDKGASQGFDRLYLHAYHLGFNYNDQRFAFTLQPDNAKNSNAGEFFSGEAFQQSLDALRTKVNFNNN